MRIAPALAFGLSRKTITPLRFGEIQESPIFLELRARGINPDTCMTHGVVLWFARNRGGTNLVSLRIDPKGKSPEELAPFRAMVEAALPGKQINWTYESTENCCGGRCGVCLIQPGSGQPHPAWGE